MVPVGDPIKQKAVLLREGFSSEEIRGAYKGWNFMNGVLQSEADRSILKRCESSRKAFDHFEKGYGPESEFHDFTITPNSNSTEALRALEDTNNRMA